MIPLRDDTPRYSTPYVTYLLIVLNVVVFGLELAAGQNGEMNAFLCINLVSSLGVLWSICLLHT